jgi:hypothetical protein
MGAVSRYVITTHTHLAGVGLSRPGHWGNLRFPDDAAAVAAARQDAAPSPCSFERATIRRPLAPFAKD